MSKSYHWIQQEIEALDPYTDYEKIWRLSSSYRLSDFMKNLVYALTFPNFVVTPHGARVVWREDGGKVLHKATAREEETGINNAIWWHYGPNDERARKSIQGINKLHENLAKKYPGDFADNADYIYTLAFSAVLMHRLRLRLGLAGSSRKERIAGHLFWQEMSKHFYAEGGIALEGFPEDFDACIRYCEVFEHTPREGTEQGHLIAEAIYSQFAYRHFPVGLRWLGRSIPIDLSLETTLETHRVKPVHPLLKALIVFLVGMFMWIGENLLPDPTVAFWTKMETMSKEERKAHVAGIKEVDRSFAPYFAANHQNDWPAACPYHAAMRGNLREPNKNS